MKLITLAPSHLIVFRLISEPLSTLFQDRDYASCCSLILASRNWRYFDLRKCSTQSFRLVDNVNIRQSMFRLLLVIEMTIYDALNNHVTEIALQKSSKKLRLRNCCIFKRIITSIRQTSSSILVSSYDIQACTFLIWIKMQSNLRMRLLQHLLL